MKSENLYVVQFKDGSYWCGLNTFDKQIRKAKIFKSLTYAREAGERFRFRSAFDGKDSYKILEIEINVIKEIE
jgi:hypothetical protein